MRNRTAKSKDMTLGQRLLIAVVGLGLIASGIINVEREIALPLLLARPNVLSILDSDWNTVFRCGLHS